MRIVGVDKVPMTPFERGDEPRKPILSAIQLRTRRAKRALAARGMVETVTWSFIAKPAAELFGGGQANSRSPIPSPPICRICDRACCRALSRRHRPTTTVALPTWRCSRSDRSSGRPAAGPVRRGRRHSPRLCVGQGHWTAWSGTAAADALDAKADAFAVLGRRRRADAGAANRAGRRELAASRPFRHHPDRSAKHPRIFRRVASARGRRRSAPTVR